MLQGATSAREWCCFSFKLYTVPSNSRTGKSKSSLWAYTGYSRRGRWDRGFVLGRRAGSHVPSPPAHPLAPCAPVTTGANSGNGCGRAEERVRSAVMGAVPGREYCQRRLSKTTLAQKATPAPPAHPLALSAPVGAAPPRPAHPWTPCAPVTTGANGGKGCGRAEERVRTAEKGAGVLRNGRERRKRLRSRGVRRPP